MRSRTLFIASLLLALVPFILAQSGMGPSVGGRHYNPATETTLTGTVENVLQTAGSRGWNGTHLSFKTDQGVYDVHVGPSSFLSAQQFPIAKGEKLEITGSKVQMNGKDVLIARTITKDGKTLELRDAQGIPKWSNASR